jgi:hypothetical protein
MTFVAATENELPTAKTESLALRLAADDHKTDMHRRSLPHAILWVRQSR